MLGYELDFNSCAIRDGFCKSSHIFQIRVALQFINVHMLLIKLYRYRYSIGIDADISNIGIGSVSVQMKVCAHVTMIVLKMASREKRSPIWNFFTLCDNDDSKATCQVCNEKISRGGSKRKAYNTTNL